MLVAFTAKVSAQTQATTQSVAVVSEKANSISSDELALHQTELLELVQRLPAESAGYAERLREVLARG
jgi:hypothetical protein